MSHMRFLLITFITLCFVAGPFGSAMAETFSLAVSTKSGDGKIISRSEPMVTQLKIVTIAPRSGRPKPTAWGIDSAYIGPGEIQKLKGVDIYLDTENRISFVKITRESNLGDIITILFTDVIELSIQTLKEGVTKPANKTPITVYRAGSLTFP